MTRIATTIWERCSRKPFLPTVMHSKVWHTCSIGRTWERSSLISNPPVASMLGVINTSRDFNKPFRAFTPHSDHIRCVSAVFLQLYSVCLVSRNFVHKELQMGGSAKSWLKNHACANWWALLGELQTVLPQLPYCNDYWLAGTVDEDLLLWEKLGFVFDFDRI